MRRIFTALFLIVTTAIFGIAGLFGIIPAVFSCMIFDAPGSMANPLAWLFILVVGSFPFVCLGAIACGWTCYLARWDRWACLVALAPLVNVLALALILWAGGELGKATGFTGELFVDRFGTPHQRLRWKAEDFFADANVVALCKAIEAKNIKEIDRLAGAGVNINAKGRGNMTPLLWAFPMGEEVFGKMLDLGADPNVQLTENVMPHGLPGLDKGKSVMSASVQHIDGYFRDQMARNVRMDNYLEQVLRHGGNPNLEDPDGNTLIFYATHPQRTHEKIRLLLAAGADINHRNRRGMTPIMVKGLCYDYKLALLKAGADYRIADDDGWDLVLKLERMRMPHERGGPVTTEYEVTQAKPVFEWLTNEGANWEAARAALAKPDARETIKSLPATYKYRPWLPQRPALKKPNVEAGSAVRNSLRRPPFPCAF
jgi:hypothetical protein